MDFLLSHAIEIVGLILGLFYLWYEYHANAYLWLFSMLMPLISMVVYYRAGLYADFSINIYYFLVSLYGLLVWKGTKTRKAAVISRIPWLTALGCVAAMCFIWAVIYLLLDIFTNSTVPVADAFTTALSIVAYWMLARKYIEQWWAWIIVDATCVWLYTYKGIYFYAVLYLVYTVVAFFGYRKWLRLLPR